MFYGFLSNSATLENSVAAKIQGLGIIFLKRLSFCCHNLTG